MADANRFAGDLQTGASVLLRVGDATIVAVFAVLVYWAWHSSLGLPAIYTQGIIAAVLILVIIFHVARLYEESNLDRFFFQVGRMSAGWAIVMMVLLSLAALTKVTDSFSRAWAIIWFFSVLGGLIVVRVILMVQIARWRERGDLRQNVVVVGAGEYGQRLIRELLSDASRSIKVLGIFDRRTTRVPNEIGGIPVAGGITEVLQFVRTNRVDEIIVALPWRAGGELMELVQSLKSAAANVK